jgi:hypothetical protein
MKSASETYERRGCLKLGNEANVMRKQHGRKTIRDTIHLNDTQGDGFLDIIGMTSHYKILDMMGQMNRRKMLGWRCQPQSARRDFRNTKHTDW